MEFLQIFAATTLTDENTTAVSPIGDLNTTATMTNEMRTFYNKTLLEYASPNLIHEQFGQKSPIPKNGGKTINFRRFKSLANKSGSTIQEGVTPKGSKLEVEKIEVTPSQFGDFVTLSDVVQLTAIDPVVVEATKALSAQGALTLDTVVRNKLVAGTNVMYVPVLGANGAETAVTSRAGLTPAALLTVKQVFKAAAILKAQNAPTIDGSYVAIVHPHVAYDLMQGAGDAWININKYKTPEKIFKGEIGMIGNVRFVESTNAKVFDKDESGTTSPTCIYATLVIGQGAYGVVDIAGGGMELIVKPLGSGDDPLNQRSTVGWKAIETGQILNQQYMVRIESGSSFGVTLGTGN
ncbi:MAG: N4-gp56 family major capsid protein [Clostridia bacterium]|nr:N4-gp56 family major capsid protein [Clostridia bacterium]